MAVPTNRIREYRSYAAIGGGFFGALIGIVGTGPQITIDENHFLFFLAIVACTASVGAIIGFFFIQLFVGQLAVRGTVRQPIGSEGNFHEIGGYESHTDHGASDDTGIDGEH